MIVCEFFKHFKTPEFFSRKLSYKYHVFSGKLKNLGTINTVMPFQMYNYFKVNFGAYSWFSSQNFDCTTAAKNEP